VDKGLHLNNITSTMGQDVHNLVDQANMVHKHLSSLVKIRSDACLPLWLISTKHLANNNTTANHPNNNLSDRHLHRPNRPINHNLGYK
jgi:hypothetical protein